MFDAALILLFCGLVAGTFATELTTGLAVALALLVGDRARMKAPAAALCVLGAALLLAAPQNVAAGGELAALREVPGRLWPLAPLLVVPALAAAPAARVERIGLSAAALVGLVAVGQRVITGADTVAGPFSHHLTLGYALVVPLVVALSRRRWALAIGCGAGVVAAGGAGPVLAAAVGALGALLVAPSWALVAGVGATLGGIAALAGDAELHQRVVLWDSGAWLALDRPAGAGLASFRPSLALAQDALEPGFHFPLHAHDSSLQLAVLAGLGSWIALAWLWLWLWRRSGRAGRAALAALAVGSLTQDVLGDLEVARSLSAWLAWSALVSEASALPGPAEPDADRRVPLPVAPAAVESS